MTDSHKLRQRILGFSALVATAALVGACLWPGHGDGGELRCPSPEYVDGHPLASKHKAFPTYRADLSTKVATIGFQVCDSTKADLDNDGYDEFLVADHIDRGFGFFDNITPDGGGRVFAKGKRIEFSSRGANSAGIVAADFNRDGFLDVANSNHPGSMTVRTNRPGRLTGGITFPKSGETDVMLGIDYSKPFGIAGQEGGLVTGDFNGDGIEDVATANLGQTGYPIVGQSETCAAGDPNPSDFSVSVLLGTTEQNAKAATFEDIAYFPIPKAAISIAAADIDGDGRDDLITANTGHSSVSILLNETARDASAPCFSTSTRLQIPDDDLKQGAAPTNPIVVDFNGDDKPDIATANWNVRTVTIWINRTEKEGAPRFSHPQIVHTGDAYPLVLRADDLDGDGLRDIVVLPLNTLSNVAMMVLRNATKPGADEADFQIDAVYTIPKELENSWFSTYFASAGVIGDYDGDGKKEIGVVVGKGSILLRAMKPGNDILKFVDPGVPLWVIHPLLPHTSYLVVYKEDAAAGARREAECRAARAAEPTEFCEAARDTLARLDDDVAAIEKEASADGRSDERIRALQSDAAAVRFEELASSAPRSIAKDLRKMHAYVDDASEWLPSEPSRHVDHDIEHSVRNVHDFLEKECGERY